MAAPSINTDFAYSLQTMEANLSELEVIKFLIEKGGRCTNYELVSNFRGVLNNPLYQAEARVKFKDIINTVATVGEYENVKYIELKQEYRDNNCNQQENFSSVSSSLSSEGSSYTSPLTQNFQPYWRYRLSTSTRVPTLPSRSPDYENVLLQSSKEASPSPAPIQFNRSVSESTLSHPVKSHPHQRQRGLSASSFNRTFPENHYRNQTAHLEENQPIRRVSVSDLDTSNRIAYNKSQASYSPERPHNLYGRHFNGILKNPPPSNHEFNRTVSESVSLRPTEKYFEGDIGLPPHPIFRRPSHHSATDLNRTELAQPVIADDSSVRTTKRSGICNDEILLKLQDDNYSRTSSNYTCTPVSACINRMHGIPAKDSFHDNPISGFSETPVSTSFNRSDAKDSFRDTSVPECTDTSVSVSINRMHGIHAKDSFTGIPFSEYSEMPVSTNVNRNDAKDSFRHTPISEYSDTSVSASINRMHGIHKRDSFHDDTSFSKYSNGSFPLENSNLNNASENTDFRKREQSAKFGTTSQNINNASIPKTVYQYHNNSGNNLKKTVTDDLGSTSCDPQKNFQCDNYQKEEISVRTPFSGLDVYSNHSGSLNSLNLGNETTAANQRVLGNLENSIQNCVEQHEKSPPLPPERRRKSQDKSRADVDVSENNSTEQMLEKGIVTVTGKVKDRVQHFDDMEKKRNTKRCLSPLPDKENRMTKSAGMEDDISISALDPKLKREWFVKAAQGDYHALVGLLKKEPKLAAIKDIGSTALHWAAKHGDANIVKLIAGAYKVNTNIRSGYTPVHVATLYKHDVIVHLLVHTYGADPSIRDYSGKRADQYPEDYIRVVAGLKTVERRPLKQRTLEKEPSLSFMRIGSLNLRKSRKSTVFASVRGSTRNFGSSSEMWLGNRASTRKKSHKNLVFEKKYEPESKNDSDSDSAYGFYSK